MTAEALPQPNADTNTGPYEHFECLQCHDSGDMNCTARCRGSQERLATYLGEVHDEARVEDFHRRARDGEFRNDNISSPNQVVKYIKTLRAISRRNKKNGPR